MFDVCYECVTGSVHAFEICVRGQQNENWLQGWVHIVPVTKRVFSWQVLRLACILLDLTFCSSLWLLPAFLCAGVPEGQLNIRRNERQGPPISWGWGFILA